MLTRWVVANSADPLKAAEAADCPAMRKLLLLAAALCLARHGSSPMATQQGQRGVTCRLWGIDAREA
jgi:hypothetical protein